MGLDMTVYGEKFNLQWGKDAPMEDGFKLSKKVFELAYWRKHPNLHGYIVETFADDIDECQRIELNVNDIHNIIDAITYDQLPYTEGFFFGKSPEKNTTEYQEQKEKDIKTFQNILKWLETEVDEEIRSVYYQASW